MRGAKGEPRTSWTEGGGREWAVGKRRELIHKWFLQEPCQLCFVLMYVIFPLNLVRREFYQTLCTDEKTEA